MRKVRSRGPLLRFRLEVALQSTRSSAQDACSVQGYSNGFKDQLRLPFDRCPSFHGGFVIDIMLCCVGCCTCALLHVERIDKIAEIYIVLSTSKHDNRAPDQNSQTLTNPLAVTAGTALLGHHLRLVCHVHGADLWSALISSPRCLWETHQCHNAAATCIDNVGRRFIEQACRCLVLPPHGPS